tara:strand:+ start:686 stop:1366 length:681 start_codon:yes stop_codon:yes gene_type:complete
MNVAICFSGQLRSLEKTYESIENFLQNNFNKFKIFAHIPLSENSDDFIKYFKSANILVEKDPVIKKTKLKNKQFKSVEDKFGSLKAAKFAHMQQLYGIYKANNLKIEYEKTSGTSFDWVIRCRSDLKFYESKLHLEILNKDVIYTPNFHHWGGINDRIVIGSSTNMDIFCNIFNHVKKYPIPGFNAENIFKNYLTKKNIMTKEIDTLKFNRVRNNGEELKDFETLK